MIQQNPAISKQSFKKSLVMLIALLGLARFTPANAQVSINISLQPLWGPVSYDYVEYYYLPEPDVYYYVPTQQFIYFSAGNWIYVSYLPTFYHVNLYTTYKVVLNTPRPYMYHNTYKVKYGKYKNTRSKHGAIRDSRNEKYYVVKGHPNHKKANVAKPNSTKPKSTKPNSTKPNPTKSKTVKSGGTIPHKAKPVNGGNKSTKPKGTKSNSTKGKTSKGGGKKDK